MTTTRRFRSDDLFRFNFVNLDHLTETYNLPFYFHYLATWPEMCVTAESPTGQIISYFMGELLLLETSDSRRLLQGKADGEGSNLHGHVTAISVAPEYRRLKLAKRLMAKLEDITETVHDGYFVDLFVRESNHAAIQMYQKFGYTIYRTVLNYYNGTENGLDMRKPMKRDADLMSIKSPHKSEIEPNELEFD